MKKIILVFSLFLLIMIPQVNALTFENVSVISNNDTYKGGSPKIEGNGTSNVTIIFDAAELKIVAANPSVGRNIDAAWVGVKVVAPKDIDINTLKEATYVNNTSSTKKSFWNNQDSAKTDNQSVEHYINVFGAITEDKLVAATKEGTMIKYYWVFDWNNDGTDDQTVTILVKPENVVLIAKDSDEVLWNQDKYNDLKPVENIVEETPKTGDVFPSILVSIITVGCISGIYTFRKVKS